MAGTPAPKAESAATDKNAARDTRPSCKTVEGRSTGDGANAATQEIKETKKAVTIFIVGLDLFGLIKCH
jgi:hypothetical protein